MQTECGRHRICATWRTDKGHTERRKQVNIISHEEFESYQANKGQYLNYHTLQVYMRSPALYKAQLDGKIPDRDTPAMAMGRAFHVLALEDESIFRQLYIIADGPVNPSTGKPYGKDTQKYANWFAEQPGDIVSTADYETMLLMCNSLARHKDVIEIMSEGGAYTETTLRGEIKGVKVQGRIDLWNAKYLVDLKTCDDIDDFERDMRKRQYDMQLSWYHMLLEEAEINNRIPMLIAVEKQAPYRSGTWQLAENLCSHKKEALANALYYFDLSRRQQFYPSGYETRRIFED
jgi:hypothetical protein